MIRRATALTLLAVLTASPAGVAATGGAGLSGGSPGSTPGEPTSVMPTSNGDATVSATAPGLTLITRGAALLNGRLVLSGHADAPAGTTVTVDRRGRETANSWRPTAAGTVAADGSFSAVWKVDHIGRFQLRAILGGAHANHAAHAAHAAHGGSVTPTVTVTVYRPSTATVYGPGLYGNGTACGQTLTRSTIGVASRTLPCGTQVALLYHGRTLVVPVIDRGPFTAGVDWDLTAATARSLGIPGTVRLGAVSLRH